jgi:hypothetical protein
MFHWSHALNAFSRLKTQKSTPMLLILASSLPSALAFSLAASKSTGTSSAREAESYSSMSSPRLYGYHDPTQSLQSANARLRKEGVGGVIRGDCSEESC